MPSRTPPNSGVPSVDLQFTGDLSLLTFSQWQTGSAVVATWVVSHALGVRGYRGTSLIRNAHLHRTSIGPWAWAYCRVLGGGCFFRARYLCRLRIELRV